jgi:hypothetical protein
MSDKDKPSQPPPQQPPQQSAPAQPPPPPKPPMPENREFRGSEVPPDTKLQKNNLKK